MNFAEAPARSLYYTRDKVSGIIANNEKQHYPQLPTWIAAFCSINPRTTAVIQVDSDKRFLCAILVPGAIIAMLETIVFPLYSIDFGFSKDPNWDGVYLSLILRDGFGNNIAAVLLLFPLKIQTI